MRASPAPRGLSQPHAIAHLWTACRTGIVLQVQSEPGLARCFGPCFTPAVISPPAIMV